MKMETEIARTKSTRDLLLDAAFSFCDETGFGMFSLNDLAKKVGISKAAIYRHFSSKDDVLEAMRNRFFDMLADYLIQIQLVAVPDFEGFTSKVPFINLIQFFADNPRYVNYLLDCMCREKHFESIIQTEMKKRGAFNLDSFFKIDNQGNYIVKDVKFFSRSVYCGMTMLFFLKIREKMIKIGSMESSAGEFASKLVSFICSGLKGSVSKKDILYPERITSDRFKELDRVCEIDYSQYPEEDRIFKALAGVIKEHGISGVTIERIAAELNMAKSSLYEYFDNKNEMIRLSIVKELALMRTITIENSCEARNLTEYIYILQKSTLEFLLMRPSVIPICGWLLSFGLNDSMPELEFPDPWYEKIPKLIKEPDFGILLSSKSYFEWLMTIPVSLVVQCAQHGISGSMTKSALRQILKYIVYGIQKQGVIIDEKDN